MPERHVAELGALVGKKGIVTGTEMAPFLVDWRGRDRGDADAVLLPASAAEVAAILRHCADHGINVFPQGGNTGLCGGAVPAADGTAILLSTNRLRAVREVDPLGNVAVVEAGVPLAVVHDAAAAHDRAFPLHLGSEGSAQIGGLISTNAGGTAAVRYGTMRSLIMGIEAVLPDGSIVRRMGGLQKDNRGYDWKHLLIGGEGTLGIVTAAALKLFPRIRDEAHALCEVKDPASAVELFRHLRERFDTNVHACELLSGTEVSLALEFIEGLRFPFHQVPAWSVILSLGDADPDSGLESRLGDFLAKMLEDGLVTDAVLAKNVREVEEVWRLRGSLSEANKRAGHGIVFDVAVRVSRAPEFISRTYEAAARIAPMAVPLVVSHLGDGNVHFIAMIRKEHMEDVHDIAALTDHLFVAVHDICEDLDGSFSAEHGIGRKLVSELERRIDPAEMSLMYAIKRAIDPGNRMAPGVLFDAGKL